MLAVSAGAKCTGVVHVVRLCASSQESPLTIAGAHLVYPAVTRRYHCITRCVRRALLLTEKLLDREQWISAVPVL